MGSLAAILSLRPFVALEFFFSNRHKEIMNRPVVCREVCREVRKSSDHFHLVDQYTTIYVGAASPQRHHFDTFPGMLFSGSLHWRWTSWYLGSMACAVDKCDAGCRMSNDCFSTFRVPKNVERLFFDFPRTERCRTISKMVSGTFGTENEWRKKMRMVEFLLKSHILNPSSISSL